MNIVFLDFDEVVNTAMWEYDKELKRLVCRYNYPDDGKVNNYQAVQWVSEFCLKFDYKIVISSSWRNNGLEKCRKYLVNGGLRQGVEVIDVTPRLYEKPRGDEITAWLNKHPDVTGYLIFDDETNMTTHMDRLVECRRGCGFNYDEYLQAVTLHEAFNNNENKT